MIGILIHLQMNITNGELLIAFVLEHQHAIDNLQPGDIKRPSAIAWLLRQRGAFRRNRRIIATGGFGLRR